MRCLADVSMNLQPKCLARSRPSDRVNAVYQHWVVCGQPIRKKHTVHANLPFVFKIAFVCDDNDGEGVLVFDSEDLLVEGAYFFEGVAGSNGVHEQEAFTGAHVLFAHRTGRRVSKWHSNK